jgi:hypothetical protein
VIRWPGIVSMAGDAELMYVADQCDWDDENGPCHSVYAEDDYLLDASGQVCRLTKTVAGRVIPEATAKNRTLIEVLELVKAHAAQSGCCCVAKLYAASIRQAIELVKSVDEQ